MQKIKKITQLFRDISHLLFGHDIQYPAKTAWQRCSFHGFVTTCQNKQNNSTLFGDFGSLLFGHTRHA